MVGGGRCKICNTPATYSHFWGYNISMQFDTIQRPSCVQAMDAMAWTHHQPTWLALVRISCLTTCAGASRVSSEKELVAHLAAVLRTMENSTQPAPRVRIRATQADLVQVLYPSANVLRAAVWCAIKRHVAAVNGMRLGMKSAWTALSCTWIVQRRTQTCGQCLL